MEPKSAKASLPPREGGQGGRSKQGSSTLHPPAGGRGGRSPHRTGLARALPRPKVKRCVLDRRPGRARRVTDPHKALRVGCRLRGAECVTARPLAPVFGARGRSGHARSGAEVREVRPGVILLAVVANDARWTGARRGFECFFGRLTGGGPSHGAQFLGSQAMGASGCHHRRRLSEGQSAVGGGWSVGMGCPGPEVVSAGGVRYGRWSDARILAGWCWSARSLLRSVQDGCRAVGRSSPKSRVQRPGAGPTSAVVIGGGGESARGTLSLVGPNRSTITARVGSNVPDVVQAPAVLVSGIGGERCRPGRSLWSQGVRIGRRDGPAVGEGDRGLRSAGRQPVPGRRSLLGSVGAVLRSPAGPKSAAVVDGPGRQGSSGWRRGGRESGDVGPGRRGNGSGDEVQRSGDEVAGVTAAQSIRRSAGPDASRDLGQGDGQPVGRGPAGRMGWRAEVQVSWWRAGVGCGVSW